MLLLPFNLTSRRFAFLLPAYFAGFTFVAVAAPSDENQQFKGLIREPLMLRVTLANGQPALLDAFVTRPVGAKRWPVALLTNGTTGTAEFDRWVINPDRESGAALAFARHGYAAVVVLREGYGYSSGGAEYTGGTCAHPQHELAGKRDAMDLLGALKAIRHQAWASRHEAILAGMSAGGFGVLAAGARNPSGVQAIINFDGGRGGVEGKALCDEPGLMKAFAAYGAASRIPTLWLYSQNDKLFSPQTGRSFYDIYTSSGGRASFVMMPPYGENGHVFMDSAPESFWWQQVADFLSKHGLPYKQKIAVSVKNMKVPDALNNAAGIAAFRKYESAQLYEKAFAIDPKGDWGVSYWARTKNEAAAAALKSCRKHEQDAEDKCAVYAINNTIMSR